MKRKRAKPHSFDDQLKTASLLARQQASELPMGHQRNELLEKARQIDAAAKLNLWLTTPANRAAR